MPELWDVYDENRQRTGKIISRPSAWGQEAYHLIIHVAVFDSRNRMLTFNGETKCVQDWAQELGVNSATILFRLKSGKTTEEALSTTDYRYKHN